jgi:hypothetical protein
VYKDPSTHIHDLTMRACDGNLTGYVQFEYKKRLYQLLWQVEDALIKCPTFVGEDEFIQDHKEEVVLSKLSGVK